jgi:hypothetical protein
LMTLYFALTDLIILLLMWFHLMHMSFSISFYMMLNTRLLASKCNIINFIYDIFTLLSNECQHSGLHCLRILLPHHESIRASRHSLSSLDSPPYRKISFWPFRREMAIKESENG